MLINLVLNFLWKPPCQPLAILLQHFSKTHCFVRRRVSERDLSKKFTLLNTSFQGTFQKPEACHVQSVVCQAPLIKISVAGLSIHSSYSR